MRRESDLTADEDDLHVQRRCPFQVDLVPSLVDPFLDWEHEPWANLALEPVGKKRSVQYSSGKPQSRGSKPDMRTLPSRMRHACNVHRSQFHHAQSDWEGWVIEHGCENWDHRHFATQRYPSGPC